VAYRFINENQKTFGLRWLFSRMDICSNAYYNYLKHAKADRQKRKHDICHMIKDIYHELNGIIGHRSMRVFLARKGVDLSKTTVHKYMNKELHLHCICRRKRPGYRKGRAYKLFPDLLKQNFLTRKPNQVWCTDFTYLYLSNGTPRYNCTIIDLFDRSVVASENDAWITGDLAVRTLKKAIKATGYDKSGLILHSDQGSQFASRDFAMFCSDNGILQSMSHAGCPYDNAPMERYYNTLKEELIYQYRFDNVSELDCAVSEFSYYWYNQVRPHSYIGYLTPFEKRFGSG